MKLDRTTIQTIIQKKQCNGTQLLQVFQIQIRDPNKKYCTSLRLSDGCYMTKGFTGLVEYLKDYDIVSFDKCKVTDLKGVSVIAIEKLERVFTNINELIGKPVDLSKTNPEEDIDYSIPSSAKPVTNESSIPSVEVSDEEPKEVAIPKKNNNRISTTSMKGVKPVKALGLHSNDWTIKVRLIKKGEMRKFTREKTGESHLIPLEFIDDEGTQISATLFGSGVDQYQSILQPFHCYLVSNGNVRMANKKYTSIKNDYCINLDSFSHIEEIEDDSGISHSAYSFTPISKISTLPKETMIDIIGITKNVGELTHFDRYDGTKTMRRALRVYDDTGHDIEITLWGSKAEGEYKEEEIYAFKVVKVREYNGKQLNSTVDTMIIKNPDDPRTKQLQEWRKGAGETLEIVSLTTTQSFTGDLALIAEVIKTAETLSVDPKGIFCWISASIIGIQSEKPFYYMGCKKCKKKLSDSDVYCEKCKKDSEAIPYYTFTIKISDGTDSIWTHVLGEQGEMILGKSATELVKLHDEDIEEFNKRFGKSKGFVLYYLHYRSILSSLRLRRSYMKKRK